MKPCLLEGCDSPARSRGWCLKHYHAFRRHGDPAGATYAPRGPHSIPAPYRKQKVDGVLIAEHVIVAERALGHSFPHGAVVHHVDENSQNNAPTNLVVCPNQAYHMLLHRRMRALEACGHAHWLKCKYCKTYDAPDALQGGKNSSAYHRICHADYERARHAA